MIEYIKKVLSESKGVPSFIRHANVFILVSFIPTIVYGYIRVCWYYPDLITPMTTVILSFTAASLGIKYLQKKTEEIK